MMIEGKALKPWKGGQCAGAQAVRERDGEVRDGAGSRSGPDRRGPPRPR